MASAHTVVSPLSADLIGPAIRDAFGKLDPRTQLRNPVMLVVYLSSILTTVLWLQALAGSGDTDSGFIFAVAVWLWFTVLFANFAESLAEGRSKAQAASLRQSRRDVVAKRLPDPARRDRIQPMSATELRKGMIVLVEAGDVIPL
ncbi:MAG: potassium-transporting ATPase subunit B, partial [Burkholderiales bacterium]|nr:potassium-transporting ATPase subunit B [Burkholderiales bacterium]